MRVNVWRVGRLSVIRNRVRAAGADEQGGPMKQLEAERLHALQQGHDGVFSGAAPLGGTRLELEVGQQVVGEHHELLPGAVGGVGLGRDA